jgi:hypothetical protein
MELDAVQVAARISQAGVRCRVGLGGGAEALRRSEDRVAVAHPDRLLSLDPGEQAIRLGDRHRRRAVLALRRGHDLAAELVGHELEAIADAEDRDPSRPERGIGTRRIRVVHGRRAARQDHRRHTAPFELGHGRVVRQELRVHVQLADASRDELRELAAEIENRDGIRSLGRLGLDALGRWGVQRLLEVGLDLGVVGGEDAVPGVRGLAVDRAAALGLRLL